MNRQQLLSRLGSDYPVLYSNGLWSVRQWRNEALRGSPFWGRLEHCDNVWLDTPPRWLLRVPSRPRADFVPLSLAARRWRRWQHRNGCGRLILYIFHPHFFPYVRALAPDYLVYHAYDLFEAYARWNERVERWQRSLLEQATLAIGSSPIIAETLQTVSGRPVRILPNGADYEAFSADGLAEPPDLVAIPRPRVGYVGNLNRKVDLPLIARLAEKRPNWQWILVGREGNFDELTANALERCRALPNVHLLGHKDHRDLPAYVQSLDVTLMAYRLDDSLWTHAIYPLKLHEYLASGRPVVSADVPSVRDYAGVIAIARSDEEWEQSTLAAIQSNGEGARHRQEIARRNSWSVRATVLKSWLDEMVQPHTE
jgi:glycosyltransferase involved in cell wall biosynthesis